MNIRRPAERALSQDILRLARIYRREVDKALAPHSLTEARALPLLLIARMGEGVRQGALADALGIEGPSLVQTLDQLCAVGLVERREDPDDRRARTLHLTDEGRAVTAAAEATLDGFRDRLMSGVNDEELQTCLRVLAHLGLR